MHPRVGDCARGAGPGPRARAYGVRWRRRTRMPTRRGQGERGGRRHLDGTRRERLEFLATGSRSRGERLGQLVHGRRGHSDSDDALERGPTTAPPRARRVPRRSRATGASCWPRSTTAGSDRRGRASASVRWPCMWPDPRRRARAVPSTTATPLRACCRPAARRRLPCSVGFAWIRRHAQDSKSTGRSNWVRSGYLDGSAQSSRSARQPLPSSSPSLPFSSGRSCLLPRSHVSGSRSGLRPSLTRMGWRRIVGFLLAIVALLTPVVLAVAVRRSPGGPVRPA